MIFRMVYKSGQIFLLFCHNSRVWQTDRRTELSSLDRVCIPCSAVKSKAAVFHQKLHFAWIKSATKFLYMKTVSDEVVRHLLAYLSVRKC